jgi:predicted PurR-regulated permease PerM
MSDLLEPENSALPDAETIPDEKEKPQSVKLDPSSPSVRSIARVVFITLMLLFIAGFIQNVIMSLTYLFFLIVLSIFFAYLLDPLVSLVRRPFKNRGIERFMPRSLAIVLSYIFVFTALGFAIANIAPRVVDQAKEFGTNVPAWGGEFRERAHDLNRRFDRLRIPEDVQTKINDEVVGLGQRATSTVGGALIATATYLPWLILVPVLAFFFLKDVNLFRLAVLRAFPVGRLRMRAEMVMSDINITLAAYTRAQLISCFLIGVICSLGFWLLGLKYALLLGILAGIFEFVPMLGPAAIGLIVIITAAFSGDPWKALHVAIFLVVLRVVHDYVTYPRIVRGGIHLHPLAIILSVIAGEQVAGIPGVFISIPIVATLTVLYRHVVEHRGRRNLLSGWVEDEPLLTEEPNANV